MNNPYPETITDESTGLVLDDHRHKFWQEGWEAREVVTIELYEALKAAWNEDIDTSLAVHQQIAKALAEAEGK